MTYTCEICKKPHTNLNDYAKCVTNCFATEQQKVKAEQERKRKIELEAQREKEELEVAQIVSEIEAKEKDLLNLYMKLEGKRPGSRRATTIDRASNILFDILPELFR